MSLHQTVLDLYDAEVAKYPEGIKTADAKEAIRESVRALLVDEPRDFDRETTAILRGIDRDREARSRAVKRDLEFILDYFIDPEQAALIPDSRMTLAVRLGERDGTDKTLRYWTAEDFIAMSQYRIERAKEATEAAEELSEVVARVIARMRSAGVDHFGDVDWPQP